MSDIKYRRGPGDHDFMWRGYYTHGYSSIRGTRIWLTGLGGTQYSSEFDGWYIQDEQERMNKEHAYNIYGRDKYCMREHSPIKCIEQCMVDTTKMALEEKIKILQNEGYPPLKLPSIMPNSQFCLELRSTNMIWYIIHNINKVKAEIKSVEQLGISLGINFVWI